MDVFGNNRFVLGRHPTAALSDSPKLKVLVGSMYIEESRIIDTFTLQIRFSISLTSFAVYFLVAFANWSEHLGSNYSSLEAMNMEAVPAS